MRSGSSRQKRTWRSRSGKFFQRKESLKLTGRSLKRQLDSKWRALDNFEASVKKLEATKMQWRAKYATKEGELDAVKVSHHTVALAKSH